MVAYEVLFGAKLVIRDGFGERKFNFGDLVWPFVPYLALIEETHSRPYTIDSSVPITLRQSMQGPDKNGPMSQRIYYSAMRFIPPSTLIVPPSAYNASPHNAP